MNVSQLVYNYSEAHVQLDLPQVDCECFLQRAARKLPNYRKRALRKSIVQLAN